VVQRKGKGGEVTQFPQFSEGRYVFDITIDITRNGVECGTAKG
jgi:hypothetical protein